MNDASLPDIRHEMTMAVPLARAWRVMTEPAYVARWLGCLNYKKKIGHVFFMQPDEKRRAGGNVEGATHCEILALDEPELLKFSWFLPGYPKTEVEFRLRDAGPSRTQVTFVHTGWAQFNAKDIRQIWEQLSGGWISFVMPGLKGVAESAE
ncbi:MAG: SRPBCC domain-containing protein [Parvularculaceae bacterium]